MTIKFLAYSFFIGIGCFISSGTMAQSGDGGEDTLPKVYFEHFQLINDENVYVEKYDTTIDGFQVSNPIQQRSFANLYIGNLGTAVNRNMADRDLLPVKLIYGQHQFSVYDFGISPGFVKNRKIFSALSYSRGTKKEQYFIVNHRQQLRENVLAGLDFAVGASQGFYARQLTAMRNFDLFGMYETKNNRYRLYAKFIYNKNSAQENGGLKNDSTLDGVSAPDARTLPVWLNDADRLHKEKAVYFQQQAFLIKHKREQPDSSVERGGPDFGIDLTHAFLFNDKGMIFESATTHPDYFSSFYYDTVSTFDSSHTRSYFNDLKLNFSLNNIISTNHFLDGNFYIGGNQQSLKINQRNLDTLFDDLSLYAGVHLKLLDICALDMKYNSSIGSGALGGDKFETGLHYRAYTDFLIFSVKYSSENKIPELFSQVNFSNHFYWYNRFDNTRQRRCDIGFDLPWLNFYSGISFIQDKNEIYFDWNGLPYQYKGTIHNTSINAAQQINYKKFHLVNKILIQKTDKKQLVRFPAFSSYHSLYYEKSFFKRALHTQIGMDIRYNSSYYAPYYQPATGEFILQNETRYGDYLFADAFINFKVKTARFFFKVEHLNKGWIKKSYILLAHYPMQGRMLKFGVTWNLYN